MRVRYSECDLQGVVFDAQYLAYSNNAMTELWRAAVDGGYQAMAADGVDMVVARPGRASTGPLRRRAGPGGHRHPPGHHWHDERSAHAPRSGFAVEVQMRHVFVNAGGPGKRSITQLVRRGLAPHLAAEAA